MTGGVLLCTSNGVGLGHLTRVMAVGNEFDPDDPPTIFTLSGAVSIAVEQGFHVEHLPSSEYQITARQGWHDLLGARLRLLIELYEPTVVVFDGVHPYAGFADELALYKTEITRVWQRRGMWKSGIGESMLLHRRFFDEIIEPGDFAAEYDRGITSLHRDGVHSVSPIVYRGRGPAVQPHDRATACAGLGLDPTRRNVLLQLGAGQINDVSSLTSRMIRALDGFSDVHVVVAQSALSRTAELSSRVTVVNSFPINRWFSAFDAGVFAAGYNSFHEALAASLPSMFVPNLATRTDDQGARARWAHDRGLALTWEGGDDEALESMARTLLSEEFQTAARAGMGALPAPTGAREAAALLQAWRSS